MAHESRSAIAGRCQMLKFFSGVIAGVAFSALVGFLAFWFWPWDINANAEPGALEGRLMRQVFDRAVARQAPRLSNPLQPTDENLMAGMKFYREGCSGCHGGATKTSSWGTTAFYPRVPQFGIDPPRRPEWQTFWIVKNGIRHTGMGAWGALANDNEIWQVCLFLSRVESLPPAVAAEWKTPHGQ
jgi:thiosulfate dehydrogenase